MTKQELQPAKPYGFAAVIERRIPYGGGQTEQVTIRRAGPKSAVKRAAALTSGFVQIHSIESYTEEEWKRTFGVARRS